LERERTEIAIKRSSGRKEKFDTNRMAQTVSRSGVPPVMANDVAKKVSTKIKMRGPIIKSLKRIIAINRVTGNRKEKL